MKTKLNILNTDVFKTFVNQQPVIFLAFYKVKNHMKYEDLKELAKIQDIGKLGRRQLSSILKYASLVNF